MREESDVRADEVLEKLKTCNFPGKMDYLAWLGTEIGACLNTLHDSGIIHCEHRPHIGNFLVSGEKVGVCDFSSTHKAENEIEKSFELAELMESTDTDFSGFIEQGYRGESCAIRNSVKNAALSILSSQAMS